MTVNGRNCLKTTMVDGSNKFSCLMLFNEVIWDVHFCQIQWVCERCSHCDTVGIQKQNFTKL